MKRQSYFQFLLFYFLAVALIIVQFPVQPVYAQIDDKPSIAFLDPDIEKTFTAENLEGEFEIQILNQSSPNTVLAEQLTINVYIIGLEDILSLEGEQSSIITRGEIGRFTFLIKKDLALTEKKLYKGFIAFGSKETGDFIYKEVTIDTQESATPSTQKDEITLLGDDSDISVNWTDLQNSTIRYQLLNNSKYDATLSGELHFLNPEKSFSSEIITRSHSISELIFDLNDNPFTERGNYIGFLIIRGPDNLVITKKVTLYYPSSGLQPTSGAQLEFLSGEDAVTINYSDLVNGSPVEIGLINKGKIPVTITNPRIIILGLVDQNGEKIDTQFWEIESQELSIDAYQIGFLSVKSTQQNGNADEGLPPRDGDYIGYLLIQTDLDQSFIVKPLTLKVAAIDSNLPTYIDKVSLSLQLWVQKMTGSQARFGAAEWSIVAVLLVLLLAVIFTLIRELRLWWWNVRGKLGPIIVEEITGKPDLTARLRLHIARCGVIPATAVPNASTGMTEFMTVVSESKIPEVKFIEAILKFLTKLLKVNFGYTIICNLVGEEDSPPVGVNVQIKMTQSGVVKRMETVEADTYEQAARNAAYFVFHYISGRKSAIRRIPEWSRFPNYASYQLYKEAELLKNAQEYSEAIKTYEEAAKDTPFNALLRLGWGDAYELKQEPLKALFVYLEATAMWPYLYGFWYRIAVNLSYVDVWVKKEWEGSENNKKEEFLKLLNDFISDLDLEIPQNDDNNFQKLFFTYSKTILDKLEEDTKFGKILWYWISTFWVNLFRMLFKPVDFEPQLSKYYRGYIPLLWSYGIQFRRMVEVAKYCTEIRESPLENNNKAIKNVAGRFWNRWTVYYNIACYYALKAKVPSEDNKDYLEEQSVDYLKKADRDPRSVLDIEWVKGDPDLESLHENLEFKALFDIQSEEDKKSEEKNNIIAKYYPLKLVQVAAQNQKAIMNKWGKPRTRSKVSPEELLAGAEHQTRVWNSLKKLAENPTDATYQQLFWNCAMQYKKGLEIMPKKPGKDENIISNLDLEQLNQCWKAIKAEVQDMPTFWEVKTSDSKFFLEHGKTRMNDVWDVWSKAEIRQWEYIDKRIKELEKAK